MRQYDSSASLFAVGADKIASAAFEWAKVRANISEIIGDCDLGLVNTSQCSVVLIETYPAGFVRLNYPDNIGYKTGDTSSNRTDFLMSAEEIRCRLVNKLLADYQLDVENCRTHIEQACSSPRSDAYDGFLSALTAWDYLRWRKYGSRSHSTTTPEMLLGHTPSTEQVEQIQTEGWILVRMSALSGDCNENLMRQSTSEGGGSNVS